MNDAQHAALLSYVGEARNALYLQAYEVNLRRDEPSDRTALASVEPVDGRLVANLYIAPGFWSQTPEEQRQTVVHELVHVIQREMTDVIRLGAWIRHVGQGTYDATWEAFRDQVEKQCDRLATIIAPLVPVPELERPEETPEPQPEHGPVVIDNQAAGAELA